MNIESCYRNGCQALQNKKMAEEINFLREQISEKNLLKMIRVSPSSKSLFSLKLSNREEYDLSYTNIKNMYESCINDEIPEFKCVNGPMKSDIALHKKKQL